MNLLYLPFGKNGVKGKSILWIFLNNPGYFLWLARLQPNDKKRGFLRRAFPEVFTRVEWIIERLDALEPSLCPYCEQAPISSFLLRETSERDYFIFDGEHPAYCGEKGCPGRDDQRGRGLVAYRLTWQDCFSLRAPRPIIEPWLRAHGYAGRFEPEEFFDFLAQPPRTQPAWRPVTFTQLTLALF